MGIVGGLVEVILYVQDMEKQVAFYRDKLGLTLKAGQELNPCYTFSIESQR